MTHVAPHRIVTMYVGAWALFFGTAFVLVEYTPLPMWLPAIQIRTAKNNDAERFLQRLHCDTLAYEDQQNHLALLRSRDTIPYPKTAELKKQYSQMQGTREEILDCVDTATPFAVDADRRLTWFEKNVLRYS